MVSQPPCDQIPKPNSKHIRVSLMDNKSAKVLVIPHAASGLRYHPTPQSMTLDTPKHPYSCLEVNESDWWKDCELCGLIPSKAKSLREAVLISTEFSCLSSGDYICSLAVEIGDTLINTFKEERPLRHNYALIPKGIAVPVVLDTDGQQRCQYDFNLVTQTSLISLVFE